MPKLSADIRQQIKSLSKQDLETIVIKAASKNKEIYDYLLINYFDKENAEMDLFEEAKKDLDVLCSKSYRAYSTELKFKMMLKNAGNG